MHQITVYDMTISRLERQIKEDRKKCLDYSLISTEKKIVESARQRLFQTIKDLEDL